MRWNRFRRFPLSLGLAVLTAAFFMAPGAAYGAESSVIEKVTVKFKTTYGEQEEIPEPEITVSGTGCSLGDVQFRTDYDNWKPGKKVRVEITVNADDGKHFPTSLNRSECKVSGAEFVSARALDDTTLQVKADYKPVMVLGNTERAGWSSDTSKKAVWKAVQYAPGYALTLYGDNKVIKRMTVETNSAYLSEYMDDIDKTYYYEVKAVPVTSDQKKYLKEGEFVTSTDQEFDWEDFEEQQPSTGGAGDGGSLKGDSYVMPDGSKERNIWKKVSGKWYYFDANGNRTRGWMNTGGVWYYMDQNGVMCTDWVNDQGTWYYLGPDGAMRTGWQQPEPGTWYYLRENGAMQTGWLNDRGTWYYLRENGVMAVNTTVDGWNIGWNGAASQSGT